MRGGEKRSRQERENTKGRDSSKEEGSQHQQLMKKRSTLRISFGEKLGGAGGSRKGYRRGICPERALGRGHCEGEWVGGGKRVRVRGPPYLWPIPVGGQGGPKVLSATPGFPVR